jgi:hypothetical protein
MNTKVVFSITTTVPTSRLVASNGVGPARMNHLLQISQHWHGSLHQSGEVPRRQGSVRRCGVERPGTGWPAIIWKRGDHEEQAGDD